MRTVQPSPRVERAHEGGEPTGAPAFDREEVAISSFSNGDVIASPVTSTNIQNTTVASASPNQ